MEATVIQRTVNRASCQRKDPQYYKDVFRPVHDMLIFIL